MGYPLPFGHGGGRRLCHLNAVLFGKAISPAREVDQRNSNAVAWVGQSTIRYATDGRLIHTSRLSQLSLAEALNF